MPSPHLGLLSLKQGDRTNSDVVTNCGGVCEHRSVNTAAHSNEADKKGRGQSCYHHQHMRVQNLFLIISK